MTTSAHSVVFAFQRQHILLYLHSNANTTVCADVVNITDDNDCIIFVMPKRSSYNRRAIRHLIDDEAGCTSTGPDEDDEFDELFCSSSEDERSSFIADDDFLEDSEEEDFDAGGVDDDADGDAAVTASDSAAVVEVSAVTAKQRKILKQFKAPGFPQYPLSSWSLTVSKIRDDVSLASLDAVFDFIFTFCNKGGLSTEVGSRAHRLHLQGVFQTLFPTAPDAAKVLTLFVKSFLADNGKGYRIVCKPLARGQNFTTMCGYITKDEGRPWFQCRVHNIPREDLQQGRLQHISALTAIDAGKIILTPRNFFSEMFKFSMRCLFPCVCPLRIVAMYAVQSAAYIPASDWVRKFSKLDPEEAQALWKSAWNPKIITLVDSDRIFFDGYARPRRRERYFVAGESSNSGIDPSTPAAEDGDSPEPCLTPKRRRVTPIENITQVLRQRSSNESTSRPASALPEFLDFNEDRVRDEAHYITFTEDRRPGPVQNDEPLLCPDTLDAMLLIVSNVRQGRMDILRDNQIAAARTYQEAEDEEDEEDEGLTESEGSQYPSLPTEFMGLMPKRR